MISSTGPRILFDLQLLVLSSFLLSSPTTLHAPPTPNRVLELDGNGSYVELPPNIFKDLEEATVNGWEKWEGDVRSVSFSTRQASRSSVLLSVPESDTMARKRKHLRTS